MVEHNGQEKIWGVLAQFNSPGELLNAASALRDAGFTRFDCHSPFPIHGMDDAMGFKRSRVSYIAALGAFAGGSVALGLQGWAAVKAYPLVISGKPFFSYQAFFPITFALAILLAAFGAIFGFLGLSRVHFHHPLFESGRFSQFSTDGFFVSIEAADRRFDRQRTPQLLRSIGAVHVENVMDGAE